MEEHQDIEFLITGSISDEGHHNLFLIQSLNPWDYGQEYVLKANAFHREFDVMRYLSSFESIKENIISVYPDRYPFFEWRINEETVGRAMIMEYIKDARPMLYSKHICVEFIEDVCGNVKVKQIQ